MTTAERVSREANERLSRLAEEATGMAGRLGEWVSDRSHQLAEAAPDGKALRGEAEGMVQGVKKWLSDLPETLERAMPVRVERRTRWSSVLLAATVGAALAYLFDPKSGRERREKLKERMASMASSTSATSPSADASRNTTTPSLSTPGFDRQQV